MKSVDLLARQTTNKEILAALTLIAADIRKGSTMAQAFSKRERLFGPLFCSIIDNGEKSGNLKLLLAKLSEYYEKCETYRKKIASKVKYPLFVWIGTLGSIFTLLLFFIPIAIDRISHYDGILPAPTKMVLSLVSFLSSHFLLVIILPLLLLSVLTCLMLKDLTPNWLDAAVGRFPLWRNFGRKNSLRRFSLALSLFISSGLDIAEVWKIAAITLKNKRLEFKILQATNKEIKDRRSLESWLKTANIFPALIVEPLTENKKQAPEGESFRKMAEFYQKEVETALGALVLVLGPAMVAFFGLLGGGALVAIYLPLLKLVGNH